MSLIIKQLPYKVTIEELIVNKAIAPSLFIKFPEHYFENWKNFSSYPNQYQTEQTEEQEKANFHNVIISTFGEFKIEDLLHPYDLEKLQKNFVENFKVDIPEKLERYEHSNSSSFIKFKAYFNYWIGYIFVEALDGYENIETFLSPSDGKTVLFERFILVQKKWEKYSDIFERLSFYKTATNILHLWEPPDIAITFGDISEYFINKLGCSLVQLETDLEKLLILFKNWKQRLSLGESIYKLPIDQLRRDIYFLFEWICSSSDKGESLYFDKWSYTGLNSQSWAELCEVIEYEEFELEKAFTFYAPSYSKNLSEKGIIVDFLEVYKRLSTFDGFWPWIRSFKDLHNNINSSGVIKFQQSRVLDYLIIITIRTEILIRSVYRKVTNSDDPKDLSNLFGLLSDQFPEDSDARRMFGTIADKENWKLTELSSKPNDIFHEIEEVKNKKNWNKTMLHCFKTILRFIVSRNYFAHHSYIDEEINSNISLVANKVIVSCVESAIVLDYYTNQSISG